MTRLTWLWLLLLVAAGACSGQGGGSGGPGLDAGSDSGAEATGPGDTEPPTFAGARSATALSETQISVAWDPAKDNETPQASIVYRTYVGLTPGGENFASPFLTSPAGATGATLASLHAWTNYFIVVRAVDASGNEDSNRHEVTAMTKDTTPPVFAGAQSVVGTSASTVLVSWNPATDNGSAAENIHYVVYATPTQGAETYSTPSVITLPGATSVTVTNLAEAKPVFVVVRAVDAAGNEDSNRHEVEGRTLDTTPPTFAGAISAVAAGTAITVTWAPATDPFNPASSLIYEIYMATSPGGENFNKPSFSSAKGATTFSAIQLNVSTTYYFVVRARDPAGNEDTNTVEVSAKTAVSSDILPPVFGGVTSVTGLTDLTLQVSWVAATDNVTPQAQIVYDIFVASVSKGEDFSSPSYTSTPGATSFTLTGLVPLRTEYVVVRARDLAGNEDSNTVEMFGTTLQDNVPTFAGVTTVNNISYNSATVTWPVAQDDYTTPANMRYSVCVTTANGGCNNTSFVAVTGTPVTGVLSFGLTGLIPVTPYWVVVRAENQANEFNTINQNNQAEFTTIQDPNPPKFAGLTSATETGPTSIQLTWTSATDDYTPPNQIVYEVYGGGGMGSENYAAAPIATDTNVTGVVNFAVTATPGTTQCYVVRALNLAGLADTNSNEHCATTPDTGPGFTSGPTVSNPTTTSLALSWTAASTPPGAPITYQVCASTTNGACNTYLGPGTTWNAATSPDVVTGLTQNTIYYFVVRATDSTASILSGQVQGTTAALPVFTTEPTVTATTATTATLSWVGASIPAGSALTYEICDTTSSTGCTPVTAFTPTAGTPSTTTVMGLTSNTNYYFVLKVTDTIGSTVSSIASGKTAFVGPSLNTVSCSVPLAVAEGTSASQSWPTYLETSLTATAGSDLLNPAGYLWCWSTSTTGCAAFPTSSIMFTGAPGWIGAAGAHTPASPNNPGTFGAALTPDTAYYVSAVVVDSAGTKSAVVQSTPCTTAVSANTNIYPIFVNDGCNGCHSGSLPGPFVAGFIYTASPVTVSGNTCGIAPSGSLPSGWEFIVPNNPAMSLIYTKMTGAQVCGGGQMPLFGTPDPTGAALIDLWITQGANFTQ